MSDEIREIRKVVRDGMVAVLVSPGWGAGWSTWNDEPELVFLPEVVEWVENGKMEDIDDVLRRVYPEPYDLPYSGGACELEVKWLPQGTPFCISECDGSESLKSPSSEDWRIA
jgi:hypothetical protein